MTATPCRPEFATNATAPPETVAGAIRGLVADANDGRIAPTAIDIASAYFNVDGFTLIADALESAGRVRLLLGAEPVDHVQHATITPLRVLDAPAGRDPRRLEALEAHVQALTTARDLLPVSSHTDSRLARLLGWLERYDVEVRRLTTSFLHGKAYLVKDGDGVIAGSSNLTHAGLAHNRELNFGIYGTAQLARTQQWFDEQWEAAEEFNLAAMYAARDQVHEPWTVFLKILSELYGSTFEDDTRTTNELGLSEFQADGVQRARRILRQRGGVIVADEVGLGKTFVAGELIREAAVERRQKVLVVAPATLRDSTWRPFLAERNIPATVVSYEELTAEVTNGTTGLSGSKLLDLDDYALVVVDEAHNLRNPSTQRADAFRHLLAGAVPKQLVLLTATPVNNSLQDLQSLVGYIDPSDNAFSDAGVPSVRQYIGRAMALDPDELSSKHLFELLDAVAVRRTRRFIKTQYPNATFRVDGDDVPITFPTARVHRVDYDLDEVLPGFFDRLAVALGGTTDDPDLDATGVTLADLDEVLSMARYVPSRFLREAGIEQYQRQNAGLLRSALLKRFESSATAFAATVETMVNSHEQFLQALDHGKVLTGDALRTWVASDTDDIDEVIASLEDEVVEHNVDDASRYDIEALREAVTADRALLGRLGAEANQVTWQQDPKIARLVDEIAAISEAAGLTGVTEEDIRDQRKVLVFTYFADTAEYIRTALVAISRTDPRLASYANRIVLATGKDQKERQEAIVGFAPRTAGTASDIDRFDIAIATDVLSEGVNLQQAGHIINYDLPWNPMRLVQRHGRIDRIGSTHGEIHLRCFFPDEDLEELLRLEEILQRKLKQAAAAFGTTEVLPGVVASEQVLAETREEIERLRREDASLFDDTGSASASSEEFQRRLARALRSGEVAKRLSTLPWGAGSVLPRNGADPGFVFCARVADSPRPHLRYVPLDPSGVPRSRSGVPEVSRELLVCLDQADPRDPDVAAGHVDGLRDRLHAAWEIARSDIHAAWMARTDPANLEPSLPRVMRRAADLVREHGGVLGARQDTLVERLSQVPDMRVQREIRDVLATNEGDMAETVAGLWDAVQRLRLRAPEPIETLPEIGLEDVRLITWMAIIPG